jgi:molecular chaperone GrpE (heat shock protein)
MSTKGVERIETAEGDEFDPNTQEAMTTMPAAEGKTPNTVAAVWQVSTCWM